MNHIDFSLDNNTINRIIVLKLEESKVREHGGIEEFNHRFTD